MNTNVIPMNRSADDLERMMRLCNTPRQQERRQQKRQKSYRSMRTRMIALHALLVSAGMGMGLMAGILIF